jgi:hypothetical protein
MSVFLRHAREIAYEHKTPARTPEHSPSQRVGCCCWEYCFLLMALHYHASSEYEEMSLAWLVERGTKDEQRHHGPNKNGRRLKIINV